MKEIIRLLLRLGWRRSPAKSARYSTSAPRPMGFRECGFNRWYRQLAERPMNRWPRMVLLPTYIVFTHAIDHPPRLLARIYGKEPYTLREMLSWPAIDPKEIVRHSLNPAERIITPN